MENAFRKKIATTAQGSHCPMEDLVVKKEISGVNGQAIFLSSAFHPIRAMRINSKNSYTSQNRNKEFFCNLMNSIQEIAWDGLNKHHTKKWPGAQA